jgi:phage baseplate assembly protein W
MAFNPQQINPNDLNPNIGLGISIPFSNPGIFASTYNTNESVKNNLINYFLTNPGELPLNPTFGAGLRNYLFEQSNDNTFSNIESFVNQKIKLYFPMIKVKKLDVLTSPSNPNSIIINLQYYVVNSNVNGTVTFNFSI